MLPTSAHRVVLIAILAFLVGGLAVGLLYHFGVSRSSSDGNLEGSGVPAEQVRDVPPFDGVELAGSNNVVIRIGEQQSVVVKADHNLLDHVTTEVHAGKLVIGNTPGSFETKSPMSVEVTAPTISTLTLRGSGNIVAGDLDVDSLEVTLPGSGTLTGSGAATRLDVTVDGSGMVQFTRLVAEDVRAGVGGSGSIFVTATRSLDASVSGSGAILYAGSPQTVAKSVTGTGAITGG